MTELPTVPDSLALDPELLARVKARFERNYATYSRLKPRRESPFDDLVEAYASLELGSLAEIGQYAGVSREMMWRWHTQYFHVLFGTAEEYRRRLAERHALVAQRLSRVAEQTFLTDTARSGLIAGIAVKLVERGIAVRALPRRGGFCENLLWAGPHLCSIHNTAHVRTNERIGGRSYAVPSFSRRHIGPVHFSIVGMRVAGFRHGHLVVPTEEIRAKILGNSTRTKGNWYIGQEGLPIYRGRTSQFDPAPYWEAWHLLAEATEPLAEAAE